MAKSEKLDLYRKHKAEYVARPTPAMVKVGPAKYLTVSGKGAPGGEAFQAAVAALYGVAFTVKMTRKFAGKGDYKVCHLEAQYWASGKAADFTKLKPGQWRWRLMIRVPTFIRQADLAAARKTLAEKGKSGDFKKVKLEKLAEGRCVQVLHVGPYEKVAETYAKMGEFVAAEGLKYRGRCHEIYLSDPRRVPPPRLRTILRHPVRER
jgi:hypothetical protein